MREIRVTDHDWFRRPIPAVSDPLDVMVAAAQGRLLDAGKLRRVAVPCGACGEPAEIAAGTPDEGIAFARCDGCAAAEPVGPSGDATA